MSLYNENNEFDLSTILLKELPEGFKVNGSLRISNSDLTFLPSGLIIRENLYLQNSNINKLPDDIIVCGKIYYDNPDLIYDLTHIICQELIQITNGQEHPQYKMLDACPFKDISDRKVILWNGNIYPYSSILAVPQTKSNIIEKHYIGAFSDLSILTYNNEKYIAVTKSPREATHYMRRWLAMDNGVLEKYKDMNLSTVLTLAQAKQLFADFTLACEEGIENFCEKKLPKDKTLYKVQDIIDLTEDYNSFYPNTLIKEYFLNGNHFVF